jgi:hypothetical protein
MVLLGDVSRTAIRAILAVDGSTDAAVMESSSLKLFAERTMEFDSDVGVQQFFGEISSKGVCGLHAPPSRA